MAFPLKTITLGIQYFNTWILKDHKLSDHNRHFMDGRGGWWNFGLRTSINKSMELWEKRSSGNLTYPIECLKHRGCREERVRSNIEWLIDTEVYHHIFLIFAWLLQLWMLCPGQPLTDLIQERDLNPIIFWNDTWEKYEEWIKKRWN